MRKKYDFNICIECQKKNKDVPCDEDCEYLDEMNTLNKEETN